MGNDQNRNNRRAGKDEHRRARLLAGNHPPPRDLLKTGCWRRAANAVINDPRTPSELRARIQVQMDAYDRRVEARVKAVVSGLAARDAGRLRARTRDSLTSAGDNRRIGYARRGVKATFFLESPIWVKMRVGDRGKWYPVVEGSP
jgi:hypothetical protein